MGHEPQPLHNGPFTILLLREWFLWPILTYEDVVPGFSTSKYGLGTPFEPSLVLFIMGTIPGGS